ncbi:hypothetical protein P692DRAFT_2064509 [Suillus brevipes Sb2]|nr:hypothetical protein P692DRAFT_2064509 [Suillus brevipes Sb2]
MRTCPAGYPARSSILTHRGLCSWAITAFLILSSLMELMLNTHSTNLSQHTQIYGEAIALSFPKDLESSP